MVLLGSLSVFSSSLLLVLDFAIIFSFSHVALTTMGLKHFFSSLRNQAMQESRASKLLFQRKLRAGPYQRGARKLLTSSGRSLDLIRSLFCGVMQSIEVIRRGFCVISSFHSAAEGLGPLARIAEPSNGGSLDVHLELSFVFLHIRAKPHHILPALCNQDSTRPTC